MIQTIKIAEDYSKFPGGRYSQDGSGNGQDFREKFLVPALKKNQRIKIILDGAAGYPSSFLEEAFGGLVREGYSIEHIKQTIEICAEDEEYKDYINEIYEFIDWARKK